MKKFIYQGPFQARSIKDGTKTIFDGNLVPGKIYDLPENHPEIEALIIGGLLEPVEDNLSDLADKAKTSVEPLKVEDFSDKAKTIKKETK